MIVKYIRELLFVTWSLWHLDSLLKVHEKFSRAGQKVFPPLLSHPSFSFLPWQMHLVQHKETTLERAAFLTGWSELSWSGRTQPVIAQNHGDNSWQKLEINKIINITFPFSAVTNIYSWRVLFRSHVNPPNLGSQTLRLQRGAAPFTYFHFTKFQILEKSFSIKEDRT